MPYICTMTACEVEKAELRKEIERLQAELARRYTLSSDDDRYVFDRDMKAQFAATDTARGE